MIYEFYTSKTVVFINAYTFLWHVAEEKIRDKVAWGAFDRLPVDGRWHMRMKRMDL